MAPGKGDPVLARTGNSLGTESVPKSATQQTIALARLCKVPPFTRLGAGRCVENDRQMQSVDRTDRLIAILIMINVVALVLLAFVL
jgi:hypothetical protein